MPLWKVGSKRQISHDFCALVSDRRGPTAFVVKVLHARRACAGLARLELYAFCAPRPPAKSRGGWSLDGGYMSMQPPELLAFRLYYVSLHNLFPHLATSHLGVSGLWMGLLLGWSACLQDLFGTGLLTKKGCGAWNMHGLRPKRPAPNECKHCAQSGVLHDRVDSKCASLRFTGGGGGGGHSRGYRQLRPGA